MILISKRLDQYFLNYPEEETAGTEKALSEVSEPHRFNCIFRHFLKALRQFLLNLINFQNLYQKGKDN